MGLHVDYHRLCEHEIHIDNLQCLQNEKNRNIIMLKVTKVYDNLFLSVYNELNRNSIKIWAFCSIFGKDIALPNIVMFH